MKKFLFYFLTLCLFNPISAQKDINLEDIWINYAYYPNGIDDLRSMKDGRFYTLALQGSKIVQYDYEKGKEQELILDLSNLKQKDFARFQSYSFSPDESKILLSVDHNPIYRHSFSARYFVYDRQSKSIQTLFDEPIIYPRFSPVGNQVAFVFQNNLFVKDLQSNELIQLTQDGEINKIINGLPDWVYEEEFTFFEAFKWSPDGQNIAFLRFDESRVKSFTMPVFGKEVYPHNQVFKYPKVGEDNSVVTIHNFNLNNRKLQKLNCAVAYEYIPRFEWINKEEIAVFTMPRLQNEWHISALSLSGNQRLLYSEKSDTYIEISDDFLFLKDKFIIKSEKDGFFHLYAYDYQGNLWAKLTKGNFDVMSLNGVDPNEKYIFFTVALPDPMHRTVYKMELGKNKKMIPLTKELGSHSLTFSSDFSYFIDTYSTIQQPPTYTVFNQKAEKLRVLEDNAALAQTLKQRNISQVEFLKIPVENEVELNAWMIKPTNFDPNKKYPVFMTAYGGPGSQEVLNKWNGFDFMWHQLLAQNGYIVLCVDNRGTGARGRDFRTITYERLGYIETMDQIQAATYVGNFPYVDKSRIGIFGWSYGGYLSSLCILKGHDVFKTAIAVAPVSNWKFYDNIYTERYMGTLQTNPNGYDDNAPTNFVKLLKGNYLLIHGTADDNVHFQNAAVLSGMLVEENKDFEQFIYTDKNHGIYGGYTRYHLFKKMTDFIFRKL